jgi:hypothetical protein
MVQLPPVVNHNVIADGDRSNGSVNLTTAIGTTLFLAVAATLVGWIGVMIVGGILDGLK